MVMVILLFGKLAVHKLTICLHWQVFINTNFNGCTFWRDLSAKGHINIRQCLSGILSLYIYFLSSAIITFYPLFILLDVVWNNVLIHKYALHGSVIWLGKWRMTLYESQITHGDCYSKINFRSQESSCAKSHKSILGTYNYNVCLALFGYCYLQNLWKFSSIRSLGVTHIEPFRLDMGGSMSWI